MSAQQAYTSGTGITQSTTPAAGAGGAGSAGGAVAADVAEKVKGGWNVFHGAGESLRGGINTFLDSAGEQVAGRGHPNSVHPQTVSQGGEAPDITARKGEQEIRKGMDSLSK